KICGTSERPRLTVIRSHRHTYAQRTDARTGHTLAAASSLSVDAASGTPVEGGLGVGKQLAERAKENGIERAVFDRNGYRYHGRVKALAEGAREGGLKF